MKKKNNEIEQKVQVTITINFIHTTDREKSLTFHVKSANVVIRQGSDTSDIITKLFALFFSKYEQEENILRNGSNFSFENVDMVGIHFHDIELKRGSSYIDSTKWIKNKKATIYPKILKDYYFFQYGIIAALHHQDNSNNSESITKLQPFINHYNQNDINFPAGADKWNKFERQNKDIALKILSVPHNKEKINIHYKSDHNRKCKNQAVLLMITNNNENCHYLAEKKN